VVLNWGESSKFQSHPLSPVERGEGQGEGFQTKHLLSPPLSSILMEEREESPGVHLPKHTFRVS
jgi:hypothetical protein